MFDRETHVSAKCCAVAPPTIRNSGGEPKDVMAERSPPRILFVDDDAVNRRALSWTFRDAGFHVQEATTGREALDLVRGRPDLVVLDVSLPDVNGFEVCRRIKEDPATHSVAVLHLSGVFVGSGDRAQGLESG